MDDLTDAMIQLKLNKIQAIIDHDEQVHEKAREEREKVNACVQYFKRAIQYWMNSQHDHETHGKILLWDSYKYGPIIIKKGAERKLQEQYPGRFRLEEDEYHLMLVVCGVNSSRILIYDERHKQ